MTPTTLYDKLWSSHVVTSYNDGSDLLYIDRQLLHEVSSAPGFAGMRERGMSIHRPATQLAVADHAVPTHSRGQPIADPQARAQVALLERNVADFGVGYIPLIDARQGIVHVIGPEQGFTLPGITLVCGDSHTTTHGAFGALAFGIGASDVECVLATQTLRMQRARNLRVVLRGTLPAGVFAKDAILAVIGRLGATGAVGHAIEYSGEAVTRMSMAERMTICNMSIEAGARTGLVAPDDTTFAWLDGLPLAPAGKMRERALESWRSLRSDDNAVFSRELEIDVGTLSPQITWGTSPDQVLSADGHVPDPAAEPNRALAGKMTRAIDYMGLRPGMALREVSIDHVFIGSCTNSRIEDLRAAAAVVAGRHKAPGVTAIVVPGSGLIKKLAEAEGLDRVFLDAGFEWRDAGCSMCVGINDDRLSAGARCASTSNRNFEGRQGAGARTHLMSPASAAASALAGTSGRRSN